MTDESTAEGGAANTPPFPRAAPDHPPQPSEASTPKADDEPSLAADADDERPLPPPRNPRGGQGRGPEAGRSRPGGGVLGRAGEQILHRAERTLYHGLGHLADQLEDAAGRIDRLADDRLHALGPQAQRAAGAAGSAASWLADTADYLRSADLPVLQRDLERQVREKPLQSLLVAAGAGWLLGKIVR